MELRVEFTKRPDGNVILRCTRRDGSVTWQRYDKQSGYFSYHDLSHFAVETMLGLRHGFYGLLADGWDISETTGKGARGPLSDASVFAEHLVGLFTLERTNGTPLHAEEFNSQIAQMTGRRYDPRLTDEQLQSVRDRITELYSQWAATPPGSTLELVFERHATI